MTDDIPPTFSGVSPRLSMAADSDRPRTESGIGALMPWADRLWAITYPAHGPDTGSGHGLFEITPDLEAEKRPESVVATCANRMIHRETDQLLIGPYAVDTDRRVRRFDGLLTDPDGNTNRLTATMEHLERPDELAYYLTMEGLLYEADVRSLEAELVADLNEELEIEDAPGVSHFKGGHTGAGRVVVTNNTHYEAEMRGERASGRLAEFDGEAWTVLEREPFMEAAGRKNFGEGVFATGWDAKSAILKLYAEGSWRTYRLPKGSRTFDHGWQTEWTRIREVETERYLMDCHGTFYELSPVVHGGHVSGIRPVCTHLRVVPDFCTFRGLLVMAGNQTTPINEANAHVGQPQSGLWFGKPDDLWEWGKPQGWGAVWDDDPVDAEEASVPFLMTGYDRKCLHLAHDDDEAVAFDVEVDFRGDDTWHAHETVEVPAGGYEDYEFPAGFSAHWVRLRPDGDCTATAQFTYT